MSTVPNWKSLQTTFQNMMKLENNLPIGQKTLWEKEKLLVTSNFSFSHKVFCSFWRILFITFWNVVCKLFQFGTVENLVFGKGLFWEYTYIMLFVTWLFVIYMYLFVFILTLSQTTNFRLSQIERVCRRHFKMWWD